MILLLSLTSLLLSPSAFGVELKVSSNCPYPIWMATIPNYGTPDLPDKVVKIDSGSSHTYQVGYILCIK